MTCCWSHKLILVQQGQYKDVGFLRSHLGSWLPHNCIGTVCLEPSVYQLSCLHSFCCSQGVQIGFFPQMSGAWVDFTGAAGSRLGLFHSIWLALASLKQHGLRLVIVLIWQPTSPRTSIPRSLVRNCKASYDLRCVVVQSCPTLCSLMDCSHQAPLSTEDTGVPGKILEQIAVSYSRGSSLPRDQTCCLFHLLHWQEGSLPLAPPGKPL